MSTCAQCQFWNRLGDSREEFNEANDYNGEELPHRTCFKIIHGNGSGVSMKGAPAAVLDGSGYSASLWTLPTFGCNAFEEKKR
jgi:hypothetical protein